MLPIIHLGGTPYDQGRTHGRAARDRVAHNVHLYFGRFEREGRVTPREVLDRADRMWGALARSHPGYADAVRGVADGAGQPLLRVVALNVRYEILYHQFTANALADGCTTFAVLPEASADGHVLMGQNWDWIPDVQGVLLHLEDDATASLAFTEAGIVGGKIGLNAAGLGLGISGLTSTADEWTRLGTPFHVRCHEVLRAATLAEAQAVLGGARSCSANFVLGQAGVGAVDIETAPDSVCRLVPDRGTLAHSNHFLDPAAAGVVEPPNPRRPGSVHRLAQMQRLLAAQRPISPTLLRRHLRDHTGHPDSVCRHPHRDDPPEHAYETVTSVVMDLDARRLWITDGPPCSNAYAAIDLATASYDPASYDPDTYEPASRGPSPDDAPGPAPHDAPHDAPHAAASRGDAPEGPGS